MASKRKTKKQPAESTEKPRKRKRKPAIKRRKRTAAPSCSTPRKRTRKALQLVLRVEDTAINSAALSKLSDGQRVDLAALNAGKSFATRPAWAVDEKKWRAAVRLVSPQWKRLRNPWATVARVYLLQDGTVGHGRGHLEREREQPKQRERPQPARATSAASSNAYSRESPVSVERLHVDETGVDSGGTFRGRGTFWRVSSGRESLVVRASTPADARAEAAAYL